MSRISKPIKDLNNSKFLACYKNYWRELRDRGTDSNLQATVIYDDGNSYSTIQLVIENSESYTLPIFSGQFGPFTNNCSILALNSPYVPSKLYASDELKTLILDVVESFAFHVCNKSILVGSDRVSLDDSSLCPYFHFIKTYGKGWNFTTPTQNRNYPSSDRKNAIFWKNIGEFTYSNYGVFKRP